MARSDVYSHPGALIVSNSLSVELSRAVTDPEGEFDVALVVSRVITGAESGDKLDEAMERFFAPLGEAGILSAGALLDWFRGQGFGASRDGVVDESHSDVSAVIESKEGIPISMAMLLLEAARRSGLDAFGINFPGHFLVSIAGETIDPLGLNVLKTKDLEQVHTTDPAKPKDVALRMLNNLKALRFNARMWVEALDIVDLQMALSEGEPELESALCYERGELWRNVGAFAAAVESFRRCAEIASGELANKAMQAAESLDKYQSDEIFH